MNKSVVFKKNLLLFSSIILCSCMTFLIIQFAKFPNKINFIEGSENKLAYGLPLKGEIEFDSVSCLSVNDEPTNDNITIDLNEENTIHPFKTGKATMTVSAFGFPVKKVMLNVLPEMEIVPCGVSASIRINTTGVMVLGTGSIEGQDGKSHNPSEGVLKSGDVILKVNQENLVNKEQLNEIIKKSEEEIELTINRENEEIESKIKPIASKMDNENKIGAWVRDGTSGIGTITYYNPKTNKFAALGHGILDVDTKKMLDVKSGEVRLADIKTVVKGKKGSPGELVGDVTGKNTIGYVEQNTPYGIFGSVDINGLKDMPQKKYKVGLNDKVHEGPAKIISTVSGTHSEEYDIYIESVNRNNVDDTKGMVIRIVDPKLISQTNGIVQGMSGSPIIQDNMIVGAVTHVFVKDPFKGYGIFIENMLREEASLEK